MKKINKTICILLMLLTIKEGYPQAMLIKNVENNVERLNVVDKKIKEKTKLINIDVIIPQITGLLNKEREKVINNEILEYTNMWISDGKKSSEDMEPTIPYEYNAKYNITNEDNILSFYIDYYQFNGGAHGITNRKTYNISSKNGEYIKLEDLFVKDFDYLSYINEEIKKEINKNPDNYFKDAFKGISIDQQFYIQNSKLVIHFPYYEIAPYAAGMPEFIIELPINM